MSVISEESPSVRTTLTMATGKKTLQHASSQDRNSLTKQKTQSLMPFGTVEEKNEEDNEEDESQQNRRSSIQKSPKRTSNNSLSEAQINSSDGNERDKEDSVSEDNSETNQNK